MRIKALVIALVIASLAGCQGSNTKTPTQKEQAAQQWNSTRASVMGSLAKSQFETGHLDKCEKTLGDALRLDPQNAGLHILAGRLAIEQGQLEVAQKELANAIQLNPKDAEAEYLSGIVYQRWQKPELAFQCYDRASQKQPTEAAYVLAKAESLVALGRSEQALTLLQGELDHFEHNPVLRHAVGKLQLDLGKPAEAIETLRTAKLLAPEDTEVSEDLAMAYFENHQYRPAGEAFQRLVNTDVQANRSELWVALGECQMQLANFKEARNSFDRATQLSPSSSDTWLRLAKVTLQLGDLARARMILQKALSLDIASAEAHLLLGYISLRQDRLTEALAEFQKSAALDRADPVSLCMVGYVMEKTGKAQQAMEYYAKALKLKPSDELASHLMASVDLSQ